MLGFIYCSFIRTTTLTIICVVLTWVVHKIPAQVLETYFQWFPTTATGTVVLADGATSDLPDTSHSV